MPKITINGYKYTEEQAAKDAVALTQAEKNLPNDNLEYWVNYDYSQRDGFYYILYADGVESVLGNPTEFTIDIPNPFEEI